MKRIFFIISLIFAASFSAYAQYPYITTLHDPMSKYNWRVGDSLFVGDAISIGVTKNPPAALYVKAKNTSASDTAFFIENSSGSDNFFMKNNASATFNNASDNSTTIDENGNLSFTQGGGVRNVQWTANEVTLNFIRFNTSNLGFTTSSDPSAKFLTITGTATNTSGTSIVKMIDMNPTYNNTSTATGDVIGVNYRPTVTSILGTHYAWLSTAGRVQIQNTAEQLRIGYDASNYVSYTVSSAGALTVDAVGSAPKLTFNDNVEYLGTFTKYNNTTTANRGAVISVGTPIHTTGIVIATPLTTVYTADVDGWYMVHVQVALTTANAGTVGPVSVKYTNPADNLTKTYPPAGVTNVTQVASTPVTNAINQSFPVYAKAGTAIQISVGYAGGTAAYSLDCTVTAM